jgi:integrase
MKKMKKIIKTGGTHDIKLKPPGKDRKVKLIKSNLSNLVQIVIDEGKDRITFTDIMQPGFKVVVSANGAVTYYHQWTDWEGCRRFDKLGRFPGLWPDPARATFLKRNELIAQRIDPNNSNEDGIPNIDDFIRDEILPMLDEWYAKSATPRSQIRKWLLRYFSGDQVKPLNKVTRRDIVKFCEWVAENGSKTTANRCTSLLSVIMNRALDLEYVDRNVCLGVKGYRETASRTRIFSDAEYVNCVKAVLRNIDHQHSKILYLLLLIPLRFQEIAAMRWSRICLEKGTYFIPADLSKNRQARTISLSQPAIDLLVQMSGDRDPSVDWAFPATSKSGHTEDIRVQFEKILAESGVSSFRIHDIRRSGASSLLNDFDANPLKIMEILGHRDMRSTLVYARLSAKSTVQASDQLGQKFNAAVNA